MSKKQKEHQQIVPGNALAVNVVGTTKEDLASALKTWKRKVKSASVLETVKDGKEYVYSPKEFVNYGSQGTPEQASGPQGRPFVVNPLLKSEDLLSKATKTNIDPKQFQGDLSTSGIKDPYQGYVWSKQDFVNNLYSQTGGRPTAYNYNPDDIFSQGVRTFYPDQYGSFQGKDENGNYI